MPRETQSIGSLRVSTCTDLGALCRLLPEWHQLWLSCLRATPFQTPHWLLPWRRHLGSGELWMLCFRAPDQRLVGVAPLYAEAWSFFSAWTRAVQISLGRP